MTSLFFTACSQYIIWAEHFFPCGVRQLLCDCSSSISRICSSQDTVLALLNTGCIEWLNMPPTFTFLSPCQLLIVTNLPPPPQTCCSPPPPSTQKLPILPLFLRCYRIAVSVRFSQWLAHDMCNSRRALWGLPRSSVHEFLLKYEMSWPDLTSFLFLPP